MLVQPKTIKGDEETGMEGLDWMIVLKIMKILLN